MLVAMLGTWEVLALIAVVLLIFGPSKLPQLGEGIGKMLRGFKKEMKAIDEEKVAKNEDAGDEARDEIDVTPRSADDEARKRAL